MSRFAPLALSLVAAVTLGLAACGGDDDDDSSAAAADATLSVSEVGDGGDVVVDSNGAAVYTSDQEASGKILCVDECESIWKPVTVAGSEPPIGSDLPGEVGTVKRPDGAEQVTLDDQPLYTFTEEGPGEVTGDGVEDSFGSQQFTWHAISAGGGTAGSGETTTTDSEESSGGYGY
jgi:predicted lipoprotein with Yx(FWY)xxD motif